jgi:protein-L-isoaspartate(D-aspartate) O-methyltransferase
MSDLAARRRYFSDELAIGYNLRTPALIEALATVRREDFLPPGPWLIQGAGDVGGQPRLTPDADPKHVLHNVSVAIDPARQLFNGGPSAVVPAIDALDLAAGERVLHVGAGLGYYTAILADVVGSHGRVLAFEVDDALASGAAENLASRPQVRVVHGDASEIGGDTFDAIFVSAGVTHPPEKWLDALAVGGRLVLPLTSSMPQMRNIGKGWLLLLTRQSDASFTVRPMTIVAIYSAQGLRDEGMNAELGRALQKTPYLRPLHLRRDPHDQGGDCWFHGPGFCFRQS